MGLTDEQKQQFIYDGYVHVPAAIPRTMVDSALRVVNHSLGCGMRPEDVPILAARSYAPELTESPEIEGLLNATPALGLAESLVGVRGIAPCSSGQIALRFPALSTESRPPFPHLDGMYSPTNGVPKGVLQNFTMLVGVLLSDVSDPYSGNFTVWPGTHRRFETWFREKGPESLLDGLPAIELGEPVQLTGSAGDLFLVHYQVAHAAAINISANIRYAIFFRLSHVDHHANVRRCMTDIWHEYPPLHPLVSRLISG